VAVGTKEFKSRRELEFSKRKTDFRRSVLLGRRLKEEAVKGERADLGSEGSTKSSWEKSIRFASNEFWKKLRLKNQKKLCSYACKKVNFAEVSFRVNFTLIGERTKSVLKKSP
jgi:hypothetical protein